MVHQMDTDVEAQQHKKGESEVKHPGSSRSVRQAMAIVKETDEAPNVVQDRDSQSLASSGRDPVGSTSSSGASFTSQNPNLDAEVDNRDEGNGLFLIAQDLSSEQPPGEPFFMEMTRLRRFWFLYNNKRLAQCRKRILEREQATDEDMLELQKLLRDQAEAIRDFQYIRSLDILSAGQMRRRMEKSEQFFPQLSRKREEDVRPFDTENYRCLPRDSKAALEPFSDEVREFLRAYLPVKLSWTDAEKEISPDSYNQGYRPRTLSPNGDRFARFIVAMVGALFILVPMYIMALHQNRTKNLITTTVAVVLFALLCSVTLRTSNDQNLGATAGYAAVLTVFVGLTSGTST